jgi:hypothetical protein
LSDPYAKLREHFERVEGVTVNVGRGAQGMKVGSKMFAMFYKGDLVLTLPPPRVEELIAAGRALAFDPGTGKPMKNRVLIPASKKRSWVKLCEEAVDSL